MSFTSKYKPKASVCSVDIQILALIPKTHMFVSYILAALSPLSVFLWHLMPDSLLYAVMYDAHRFLPPSPIVTCVPVVWNFVSSI